jgi:hypothetical protein
VPFNWLVEYKTPTGDSYNVIHKAAVDREDSPLAVVARAVADGESSWGRVKALYDQSNVPRSNTLATVK